LTDKEAEKFWPLYDQYTVAMEQSTSQLRLTYGPKFRNVSAKSTALFFQLDRRLTMLIDVQLASQIPLIQR